VGGERAASLARRLEALERERASAEARISSQQEMENELRERCEGLAGECQMLQMALEQVTGQSPSPQGLGEGATALRQALQASEAERAGLEERLQGATRDRDELLQLCQVLRDEIVATAEGTPAALEASASRHLGAQFESVAPTEAPGPAEPRVRGRRGGSLGPEDVGAAAPRGDHGEAERLGLEVQQLRWVDGWGP
jgi:hypothetical protein